MRAFLPILLVGERCVRSRSRAARCCVRRVDARARGASVAIDGGTIARRIVAGSNGLRIALDRTPDRGATTTDQVRKVIENA